MTTTTRTRKPRTPAPVPLTPEQVELEESLELEGHVMLVAMQEAVIGAINA